MNTNAGTKSKRLSCAMKFKIKRKVAEKHRKDRKEARINPQRKGNFRLSLEILNVLKLTKKMHNEHIRFY
jgi:hypothetical protein